MNSSRRNNIEIKEQAELPELYISYVLKIEQIKKWKWQPVDWYSDAS